MAKHIHIHLGRTKDADGPAHAPAGSSKGGQFVSGGAAGGSQAHHAEKYQHHIKQAYSKETHPDNVKHHAAAAKAHSQAGGNLESAKIYAGRKAQSKNPDYHPDALVAKATKWANIAASHEAKIKPDGKPAQSSNSSGMEVKHQPTGTQVKHQAPKYSPMKQANRDLEAKQLKESKQIAKAGVSPGVNPGVRQMQAKADVEEAKLRIAAKKK